MYLIKTLSPFVCIGCISSVKWPQITRLGKNVTKWIVFSGGSRPSDKGGARSQKKFFRLFGPQFGLKIRGKAGPRAVPLDSPLVLTLGSLRYHDGDVNENVKKAIGWIGEKTTLHVHHAFLYISLPTRKQATTKFSFSLSSELGYGCLEFCSMRVR